MDYQNQYRCPDCGTEWDDVWDCACDDDCPACGTRHISPFESTALHVTDAGQAILNGDLADVVLEDAELADADQIAEAREKYAVNGFVVIPDDAKCVDASNADGAWIQAWVWVGQDSLETGPSPHHEPDNTAP